jgi:hypothetical protein
VESIGSPGERRSTASQQRRAGRTATTDGVICLLDKLRRLL